MFRYTVEELASLELLKTLITPACSITNSLFALVGSGNIPSGWLKLRFGKAFWAEYWL